MNKTILSLTMFCSMMFAGAVSAQEGGMPPPPPDGPCGGGPRPPECSAPCRKQAPRMEGKRLDDILAKVPEADRVRLKKLAEENPEAFRKEIFRMMDEARRKERKEIMDLRQAYLNAADDAAKEQAKAALRAKLKEGYQRHLEISDRRIKNMEGQLAEFQKRLENARKEQEKQRTEMDANLDKILADFTDPSKEPFPPRPPKRMEHGMHGQNHHEGPGHDHAPAPGPRD